MVVVLGEQAQCYRGNGVMAPAPVQSGKQAPAFLEGRGGGGGGGGRGGLTFTLASMPIFPPFKIPCIDLYNSLQKAYQAKAMSKRSRRTLVPVRSKKDMKYAPCKCAGMVKVA